MEIGGFLKTKNLTIQASTRDVDVTSVGVVEDGEVAIVASVGHVEGIQVGRNRSLRPPSRKQSSQLSITTDHEIAKSRHLAPDSIVRSGNKTVVREVEVGNVGSIHNVISEPAEAVASSIEDIQGSSTANGGGEGTSERATGNVEGAQSRQIYEKVVRNSALELISLSGERVERDTIRKRSGEGRIPV